jgi:hypothetical protein
MNMPFRGSKQLPERILQAAAAGADVAGMAIRKRFPRVKRRI